MKQNNLPLQHLSKGYIEQIYKQVMQQIASNTFTNKDLLYTDEEVAQILKTTPRTVRRLRNQSKFSSIPIGNRHYYIKSIFMLEICSQVQFVQN